ncbi:CHAT domain-containing protein [Streptomyces spinosirectus]|jgi:hypothetical protein|uniref:CHAT domain-containing protein n=1 Tax=Streptomyces TaxID=1883 RepID=UPI001F27766D|nr:MULTISPECIES: CHAT domain-containing protein [Streptomyces]UIR23000.1 CHAT domain-containing protein [Streptomyces spinosirectus]
MPMRGLWWRRFVVVLGGLVWLAGVAYGIWLVVHGRFPMAAVLIAVGALCVLYVVPFQQSRSSRLEMRSWQAKLRKNPRSESAEAEAIPDEQTRPQPDGAVPPDTATATPRDKWLEPSADDLPTRDHEPPIPFTSNSIPELREDEDEDEVYLRATGHLAAVNVQWPMDAPTRYINTFVAHPGEEEAVTALDLSTDYELLLNIGRLHTASLLSAAHARWPWELLPGGGHWLRAALLLEGRQEAVTVPFHLPATGESFVCDCEAGLPHTAVCAPRTWVRLPVRTPDRPGVLRGELLVYYEAAAVVAMRVELPAGTPGAVPHLPVVNKLTRSFGDLGKLARRTASVVTLERGERVVVNGTGFLDSPFAIGANAADTSAANVRTALFDSHFSAFEETGAWSGRRQSGLRSRYDERFAKSHAEYERDLRRLAVEGSELYLGLFCPPGMDSTSAYTLPDLLRHEARIRARPPLVQIVDTRTDEHAMLWSAVYDLPVSGDPDRHDVCPSVRRFGPEGDHTGPVPPVCPYEDTHTDNILCPYGFWGLSCLLEQPPTVGRDLETVVHDGTDGVALLAAVGSGLDARLAGLHVDRLREGPPTCLLDRPSIATESELVAALQPEAMDVVYFYCHCGYDRRSPLAAADRYLDFGGFTVKPLDVTRWARSRDWEFPHWQRRRPLVVLNGCHTSEANSGTLNRFVPAFTQWAGASGVVGTEVAVEQGLAGWVMELLLARLLAGDSAADALRSVRWAMLRRGNVMGLAYTAYCLANLALRPTPTPSPSPSPSPTNEE